MKTVFFIKHKFQIFLQFKTFGRFYNLCDSNSDFRIFRIPPPLLAECIPLYIFFIYLPIHPSVYLSRPTYNYICISSECSAQGQVLHYKRRNLGCSSAEDSSSNEPRLQFYQELNRSGGFPLFSAPLSLTSQQTLKHPRGTNLEARRVDLANWALRSLPKFTTGVKYQFHQGF